MEERSWIGSGKKRGDFSGGMRGTRDEVHARFDNTVSLTLHPGANLGGGDQIRWNSIARVSGNLLRTGVLPGVQI